MLPEIPPKLGIPSLIENGKVQKMLQEQFGQNIDTKIEWSGAGNRMKIQQKNGEKTAKGQSSEKNVHQNSIRASENANPFVYNTRDYENCRRQRLLYEKSFKKHCAKCGSIKIKTSYEEFYHIAVVPFSFTML